MTDPNTPPAAWSGEAVRCGECGRDIGLTRWSRLAPHNLTGGERCPGSGRLFSWPNAAGKREVSR